MYKTLTSGLITLVQLLEMHPRHIETYFFAPFCSQDEPMDTDQSSTFLSSIQSEIAKYQLLIEEENQKLKRYKVSFCSAATVLPFYVTFAVI